MCHYIAAQAFFIIQKTDEGIACLVKRGNFATPIECRIRYGLNSVKVQPLEKQLLPVKILNEMMMQFDGSDFQIETDETVNGIRHIIAYPSALVCSRMIEIELKDNIIESVIYTRGCDGNAKGLGALIKGMAKDEAVKRLRGIRCGSKQTSCPDQLARILEIL